MSKRRKHPRKETFSFTAPDALSVLLVGEFTEWQQKAIALEKGNDGVWTTTVTLPQGTHNYLFIVDGEWCDDPNCAVRVPNPFGGHDMVRQVA